jgi:hypothetical protein
MTKILKRKVRTDLGRGIEVTWFEYLLFDKVGILEDVISIFSFASREF